jgi:hypothetical protein
MASKRTNKAELLEQAKSQGLDVNTKTTVAELREKLGTSDEVVTVNENKDGEATNNTTEEGNESSVENTESIPQNGVTEIETLDVTDNPVAKKADDARTEDEVKFADESNPNQKARTAATNDADYDQDGNLRTGGKSYGVADDDVQGVVFDKQNEGQAPENTGEHFTGRVMNDPDAPNRVLNAEAGSDEDVNAHEWTVEDQQKLEDQLSDPKNGVQARVTTSTGDYVRVKFFFNNKPLGTYKSRGFDKKKAVEFRKKLVDERGL